jgi:16S rRNA (cytosine967-C5)-methyltransferase
MNAREAAYNALNAVLREGAYTSFALKKHIPSSFSAEDRHFVSLLLRTTLENLIRIDFALSGFIKSGRVHGSVRNILRLGACQLLFMDTQGYAAVNESVSLAKKIKPQTSGFVNAVLRALEKGRDSLVYPKGKDAKSLSVSASYPEWICEKYIKDFGWDFARDLLTYKAQTNTSVRMNPLKTDTVTFLAELQAMGLTAEAGDIADAYAVSGLTDIENLDLFTGGKMAVQSLSAMRAVRAIDIKRGDKLLDCCAAPGGKSAYAAALTNNDIQINAWDIHEHRVDMTRKNYERLGIAHATADIHDARVFEPAQKEQFDVVLVDTPCSAMGLMAHNPDIRYTRKPEDIESLAKLQMEILTVCARYVRPKGTLAYMTCSINKEENENVTDAFLSQSGGFSYCKPPETLYPHLCESDGFYYAIMRRQ